VITAGAKEFLLYCRRDFKGGNMGARVGQRLAMAATLLAVFGALLKADLPATTQATATSTTVISQREVEAQYRQSIKELIKKLKASGYAGFEQLSEEQRDCMVWQLHEDKQWGQADQKLICRDLLATQGHSFANAIAWTCDAIDLAEKQGWNDLDPLIARIYERPRNIWVYERAFRYLRSQAGRPVPASVIAEAEILKRAADWRSQVTDAQLASAKGQLMKEPDREAVLVYSIGIAGWNSGKGGNDRGREAAVEVLKTLDRDTVARRLRQLRQDCSDYMRDEIEWAAARLGVSSAKP
jgi:hypothetical protein